MATSALDITFPGNLAQVPSIEELRALPSGGLGTYSTVLVKYVGLYSFDPASFAADDGDETLKPNDLTNLQAGRWILSGDTSGGGGGQDGSDGLISVQFASTAADWSALPNLARKIRQAAFNGPGTKIKFAGVGSSNMLNEGGGLAGVGNSPVEVAMRQAKAQLDPFGFCEWEFANYGVNGAAIVSFNDPAPGGGPSPQANLAAYQPDVTIVCYGTNDSAPESWNTGQTRDYIPIGVSVVAGFCASIDSDAIFLTVPSAHVGRAAPIKINQGIPVLFPKPSFQVGQAPFTVSFIYTAANQRITGPAGIFTSALNGFGIAVGKAIFSTDANLGSTIANVGIYRIAEIDPAGAWVRVDRKLQIDGTTGNLVDIGPANIVNDGPVNAAIKRVGIDNTTELQPNMANGDRLIEPLQDGRQVRVLTRYIDVNQRTREAVMTLDVPASLVDMEARYHLKLLEFSEDRYYAPTEIVHWNAQFVADIMEPAFESYFKSLGSVDRALSTPGLPLYQRRMVVRPSIGLLAQSETVDRESSFDVQVADGEDTIFRNSDGNRHAWVTDEYEPKRFESHFDLNQDATFKPYRQNRSFTTDEAYKDLPIPNDSWFTIRIDVYRSGIGSTTWRVEGVNISGSVTYTASTEHEVGNPGTITLSAVGSAIRMTLFDPPAQTFINAYLWIRPQFSEAV